MSNKIINNNFFYWGVIVTFIVLYLGIAFVSTLHAVNFFRLANPLYLAIILGSSFETGLSMILFYILLSKDKKILPWVIMSILVVLQISGNVYSSFKFIELSKTNDWMLFQRSLLFAVQSDSSEMYKIIISFIQGGILPICAMGLTSLVSHIIQEKDNMKIDKIKPIEVNEKTIDINQKEANNKIEEAIDPVLNPEIVDSLSSVLDPKKETSTIKQNETDQSPRKKTPKKSIDKILKKKTKIKPIKDINDISKPSKGEEILKNAQNNTTESNNIFVEQKEEIIPTNEDLPQETITHNGVDIIEVKPIPKTEKIGIPLSTKRKNFDKL